MSTGMEPAAHPPARWLGTRVPRALPSHGAAAAWTEGTEAPKDRTSYLLWTRGRALCVTMATRETREKEWVLDWLFANYAEPGSEDMRVLARPSCDTKDLSPLLG